MGLRKNRVEGGVTRPVDAFEKGSEGEAILWRLASQKEQ